MLAERSPRILSIQIRTATLFVPAVLTRTTMQKLMKVPAAKNCLLRPALWIIVMSCALWQCPDAYSQVGKAPGGLPAAETGFRNFSGSHGKDRLLAFMHARNVKRMPESLAIPNGHSPMFAKAFKNNPDSLINLAFMQGRMPAGGRLPLYRADLAGTPGNMQPPDGNGEKSRRETKPLTLDEYIWSLGTKKKQ